MFDFISNSRWFGRILFALSLTSSRIPTNIEPTPFDELSNGLNHFTQDFYQQCIQSTNGNVIFSPFSILNALTLLSQATEGNTFEQLKKGLYLNENKTITGNQFYELSRLLQSSVGQSTLSIANQIYVQQNYSLNKNFLEVAVQKFSSGIDSVNFANRIETAKIINNFVKEKTHDKIKDLINPDVLDPNILVVLINAIYFKGNWQYTFKKTFTKKDDFYISETEKVSVDFMRIKSNFEYVYSYELDASALSMNYANSNFSFVIVLPESRTGLSAMEAKLKNFDIKMITYSFEKPELVRVTLPKFKIEYEIDLKDGLKNLGMGDIFIAGKANLSGLLESSGSLYVSEAKHKAFIEVNEEGSEAAAATFLDYIPRSSNYIPPPPTREFKADHPFVYYIWDKGSRTPIFVGRITRFD